MLHCLWQLSAWMADYSEFINVKWIAHAHWSPFDRDSKIHCVNACIDDVTCVIIQWSGIDHWEDWCLTCPLLKPIGDRFARSLTAPWWNNWVWQVGSPFDWFLYICTVVNGYSFSRSNWNTYELVFDWGLSDQTAIHWNNKFNIMYACMVCCMCSMELSACYCLLLVPLEMVIKGVNVSLNRSP